MNLKKLTDAYFSKEAYERKKEYAYRKSSGGIRAIAEYYAQQDGLTEEDNEYEDAVNDYETIFEPVSELSHLRHEIHSSGMHYNLDFWKSEYETLIDEVNELNQKYELAPTDVKQFDYESLPDTEIMSNSEICDFMGWDESDWLDEDGDLIVDKKNEFYDNVAYAISEGIDEWSNSVREWFWYVNQKFGTDFPDKEPNE
jgi:hypothetical protein